MKKLLCSLIAIGAALVWSGVSSGQGPGPGSGLQESLTAAEQDTLIFMREEEKLARDVYVVMYDTWAYKVFQNISLSEQKHMDTMLKMLDKYDVADPVTSDATGVFTNTDLKSLYQTLIDDGGEGLLEAFMVGAQIEEQDIFDLTKALAETDKYSLTNAYSNLRSASYNHLRTFVAHITNMGVEYEAQVLSQDEVDGIVGDYDLVPPQGFAMNAGMSDAWYFPDTAGQGFFLTVMEQQRKVFMGWFTYDTEPAGETCMARLGDPGHRWITAQGSFAGAQADLEIDVASGGIFDSSDPAPAHEANGSILLQFEDCMSGSLYYDIPSIGRSGLVPIRRVANDNVALCEQLSASAATD